MKYKAEKYFFDILSFPISSSIEKKLRILYRKFPNYSPTSEYNSSIIYSIEIETSLLLIYIYVQKKKKEKYRNLPIVRSERKKERKKNQRNSFYLYTWSSVCPFSPISFSLSFSLATYIPPKSMPFIISRCTVSDDGEARRIYGVFSTEYPFQYTTYTVER